jgi:DegV family protein with EDD domain
MTIRIVTDSTCDLPQNIVKGLDITVVPLFINIGEDGYLDGVDISREDFYTNLPTYTVHPTTGTPGIDAFTQAYAKLASKGATKILSIHISKSLSATVDVAEVAAGQFNQIPVVVRDSLQLSTGTGFQVETAARMVKQGKTLDEIIEALDSLAERSYVAAGLNSLEYLRRSGRMNAFMSGLGSLIKLKPILTMKMGLPGSVRVRTDAKAETRLVEMLTQHAPIERFVMLHTNAPERAAAFRSRVADLIPKRETISLDITPAIGAHLGPGAIGYAIVSKKLNKNE